MKTVVETALSNAFVVVVLAALLTIVSRVYRKPALMHCLWVVILIKLITPPVFPIPISLTDSSELTVAVRSQPPPSRLKRTEAAGEGQSIDGSSNTKTSTETNEDVDRAIGPDVDGSSDSEGQLADGGHVAGPAPETLASTAEDELQSSRAALEDSPEQKRPTEAGNDQVTVASGSPLLRGLTWFVSQARPLLPYLIGIWIAGSCFWLTLVVVRIRRFTLVLRYANRAEPELQREVALLAQRFGLRCCPEVFVVPGIIPPMLWTFGRAKLMVPAELLQRLSRESREGVLLHELAHFHRGDHWVRILEIIATALYWWHPVVWWARREIQQAEEECCDGWVVAQLASGPRAYADALLQTVEFLSAYQPSLPPVASGMGHVSFLKRRVTSIMLGKHTGKLGGVGRIIVWAWAAVMLPFLPMLASGASSGESAVDTEPVISKTSPTNAKTSTASAKLASATEAAQDEDTVSKKTASASKSIEPVDFENRPTPLQFVGQEVRGIAISSDGKLMAVGHGRWTTTGRVRLWNLETQKEVASWKRSLGVSGVDISPDGRLLAAASWDHHVVFYDTQKLKELRRIETGNSVARIAFSPDGKVLATATKSAELTMWNVETVEVVRNFNGDMFNMQCVRFSRDGKLIAVGGGVFSGTRFGRVAVWEVESGKQIAVLNGHTMAVLGIAFSPNGKTLASTSLDNTIRQWDVVAGKQKSLIPTNIRLTSIRYSHDGKLLATAGNDNSAKLWDASSGEMLANLAHDASTIFAAFSPNDKTLYSGGMGKVVRVWDVTSRQQTAVLVPQTDEDDPAPVLALAYSPNGRLVASAHEDKTVRLRDAVSGEVRAVLTGHEDVVAFVAFSSAGKTLATASYDGLIKLWDVKSGQEKRTLSGHTNWVFSLAFSPDGKMLASGSYDKTVRTWNLATGKTSNVLKHHTAAVRSVAYAPDGKTLDSGSSDRTVRIWDTSKYESVATLKGHSGTIRAIVFSPDGKTLATASEDKTVKLWDVKVGGDSVATIAAEPRATLSGHEGMVWCLAFSPRGRTLASGGFDNRIKLWDPADGTERATLQRHSEVVTSLAFAPDGKSLISGSFDMTLNRWLSLPPATLPLAKLEAHTKSVAVFVAFTPDSRRLVTIGRFDREAKVWDVKSRRLLRSLSDHAVGIRMAALSPNGKLFATATPNRFIRLWNIDTGTLIRKMKAQGAIRGLAFSPDGTRLTSAGSDKTAKVWDVETGKVVLSLPEQELELRDIVFSPDGTMLAISAGADQNGSPGGLKLWNAETGEELATLAGHARRVNLVRFSPDGKLLASVSNDRRVILWDVATRARLSTLMREPNRGTTSVEFLDNDRLAVGTGGGAVSVFAVKTGKRLVRFAGHKIGGKFKNAFVWSLARSPDKTLLASASSDSEGFSIKLWPIKTSRELAGRE